MEEQLLSTLSRLSEHLTDCPCDEEFNLKFVLQIESLFLGRTSGEVDDHYGVQIPSDLKEDLQSCALALSSGEAKLVPFEIHSIGVQAVAFSEGDDNISHFTACLLVCCAALRTCPSPITSRPKRWRSCQLESIRLFQRCFLTENKSVAAAYMWTEHVLPSCQNVQSRSPELIRENAIYKAAWISSVVGIATQLISGLLKSSSSQDVLARVVGSTTELVTREHLLAFFSSSNNHIDLRGKTETNELTWNEAKIIYQSDNEMCDDSIKEDLLEIALHVNTTWDPLGVSYIAASRSLSDPDFPEDANWLTSYFPIVAVLLDNDVDVLGFGVLKVLDRTRPTSLVLCAENSPIGLLQIIANRIVRAAMRRAQVPDTHSAVEPNENYNDPTELFDHMNKITGSFDCMHQVSIIAELMLTCPFPGMKPRLVDLLRSYVSWSDTAAVEKVWDFAESFTDSMGRERDETDDYFLDNIETTVAALSLLELWARIKRQCPDLFFRVENKLRPIAIKCERLGPSLSMYGVGLLHSAISNFAALVHEYGDS